MNFDYKKIFEDFIKDNIIFDKSEHLDFLDVSIVEFLAKNGLEFNNNELIPLSYKPKYKKGDWIISLENTNLSQIIDIKNSYYCVYPYSDKLNFILKNNELEYFKVTIKETDLSSKLWTLADAKDGDILIYNDSIFIFNEIYENHLIYYGIYEHNKFHNDKYYSCLDLDTIDINNIHPATEEQKNTLFETMFNENYKWDKDKKELIKKSI